MKYLFYIEVIALLFFITLLCIYVPGFSLLFLNIGIFYIFVQLCQFNLIKLNSIIRRPKSLIFNIYCDYEYDTFYDVVGKDCWKLVVRERKYHTIRTINFVEYVVFFYSRM